MNINVDAFPQMGIFTFTQIGIVIVTVLKQILMIWLMIKGTQIANIYIKNNKDKPIE